jgi:hypothetical protein
MGIGVARLELEHLNASRLRAAQIRAVQARFGFAAPALDGLGGAFDLNPRYSPNE